MGHRPMALDELVGWDALLDEEEQAVRQTVRRFVRDRCMPRIVEAFENAVFPDELIAEIAGLELLGGNLTGYGCPGLSSVAYGLACAELEACDTGLRSFVSVQTSLCMYAIWRFGSEEQKEKWLPEMARGRVIGCFGLTEPNHGSDPGSMETRAKPDGNEWVLHGRKMWITNAQIADIAIVWARTGDRSDSIAGFIVERGTPGFETESIERKLSLRASHTGSLVLDEVRVPAANRLPAAAGLRAPLSCLNNARFGVAFGVLGAMRACIEQAVDYTRDRVQFGVPIASKQLVQAELADMAQQYATAAIASVHYGRLKDAGKLHPVQVSLLKRNNCRTALLTARRCRALLGANGITGDYHVMRHAMNLESTYTYEGTHEIHTLVLGRALTGHSAF